MTATETYYQRKIAELEAEVAWLSQEARAFRKAHALADSERRRFEDAIAALGIRRNYPKDGPADVDQVALVEAVRILRAHDAEQWREAQDARRRRSVPLTFSGKCTVSIDGKVIEGVFADLRPGEFHVYRSEDQS